MSKNIGSMNHDTMYEPTENNIFEVSGQYLDRWKDFYPKVQEMMPWNILEVLGIMCMLTMW